MERLADGDVRAGHQGTIARSAALKSDMPRCRYQGSVSPIWKYPPVGPLADSSASCTLVLAPSGISIGAASVPISVFTQPGCAEFTLIFVSRNSAARCTVKAFNAAFEALYAKTLDP